MAVIDRDLVRAINSGRCFAIVGSGPSCEEGLPSWRELAEKAVSLLAFPGLETLHSQAAAHLRRQDFPSVFKDVEKGIGWPTLIQWLRSILGGTGNNGRVYDFLANWPFACYLTTNFESRLLDRLSRLKATFVTRGNSLDDMRSISASSTGIVLHLHGHLADPASVVLTSDQYSDFSSSPSRAYWRDKLFSIFNMVDILIVGYSAKDPDFLEQLERAKGVASPGKPIFMIAADLDPVTVRDLHLRCNIRVLAYNNPDGKHRELFRLLHRYDPFIAKRASATIGLPPVDEAASALAASLHLFTKLRMQSGPGSCIEKTYACSLLQVLNDLARPVPIAELGHSLLGRLRSVRSIDPAVLEQALSSLHDQGFVSLDPARTTISIAPPGLELIATLAAEGKVIREKYHLRCTKFLKEQYSLVDSDCQMVADALNKGVIRAFERRGIEIARSVFTDDPVDLSDATDLLDTVNATAATIATPRLHAALADLMIEIILRPSSEVREYLAALSQGYFAYHALGLDPNCSIERLASAKSFEWVLDSSVLIPLLAVDSQNHEYASDLFARMRQLEFRIVTTDRLCSEVVDHLYWATSNFADKPLDSPQLLQAAMAGPGYKQNLFLDGYVSWATRSGNPTLSDYVVACLGDGSAVSLGGRVAKRLSGMGVEALDVTAIPGFSVDHWPERDAIARQIEQVRRQAGTYRSDQQCTAEAEVILASRLRPVRFVSQSTVLDRVSPAGARISWRPEALYRFLSMFAADNPNAELLYDCMIQDFYYSGIEIINTETIRQFAGPMVRQARMTLESERVRYEAVLGKQEFSDAVDHFENLPDEQKPFYSLQFALFVSRRESILRTAAEQRAAELEKREGLSAQERTELERLRAKKKEKASRASKQRKGIKKGGKRKSKKKR
jgi:hypothetical protein